MFLKLGSATGISSIMGRLALKRDPVWWQRLAALPNAKNTLACRRVMRVFADQTMPESWGPYSWDSGSHLVVNVFENFSLDPLHLWVRWLANRLDLRAGEIRDARWSYEYQEKDHDVHADVIIGWRDDAGEAAIAVEAKRPGELGKAPLNPKDDPLTGHYLDYAAMQGIPRRKQILLVSRSDLATLPSYLRASPQLLFWEELAAVQRAILTSYDCATAEDLHRGLRQHHAHLGIALEAAAALELSGSAASPEHDGRVALWLAGFDSYRHFRKDREFPAPMDWLHEELPMRELHKQKKLGAAEWFEPLWRVGTSTSAG